MSERVWGALVVSDTPVTDHTDAAIEAKRPDRLVVAHLSDLHFTPGTKSDGDVLRAVRVLLADKDRRPDLIVVTGDIADSPLSQFFETSNEVRFRTRAKQEVWARLHGWETTLRRSLEAAHRYLTGICIEVGISPERQLLVVPGNHDLLVQGLFSAGRAKRSLEIFEIGRAHV